jgi:arsenate reductase
MSVIIYHNVQCSKSRATLDILKEKGVVFEVINYLNNPPNKTQLIEILRALDLPVRALMRTGETAYKTQNLAQEDDENKLIEAMINTPILIQRPIVKTPKGMVIARPPELVLKII